jgi:hypothetical protein
MSQFYDPYLASVPYDSAGPIQATHLSNAGDLALPMSIMWTDPIPIPKKCGGANLDGLGDIVNFSDYSILASQWLKVLGSPSADIAPEPLGDGIVDSNDFNTFAENWLETNCN